MDYFTIRKMPLSAMKHYIKLLPVRQAEMRMMLAEAATVPHMDDEKHREWKESVNQYFEDARKSEVAAPRKLMGIGIKAVFVAPTRPK